MFKRSSCPVPSFFLTLSFTRESITQRSQVKASVQRGIKSNISSQYPMLEPYIDDIFPKKTPMLTAKSKEVPGVSLILVGTQILFIEDRKSYIPTLRLIHQYPFILKKVGVDKGAIKFVLQGANVMCPGLTHPAGFLDVDFDKDEYVAIFAEGKTHPLAIAKALMSRDEIRKVNSGHGLEVTHFLGDPLWELKELN